MSLVATSRRLQHRVSIDAGMGELYHWLASMDSTTRSREILYLVRLGSEVHFARRAVVLAVQADAVGSRAAEETERRPAIRSDDGSEGSAARSSAALMSSWDLNALCTPPPRTGRS